MKSDKIHASAATNGSIPFTYMYSWIVQLGRSKILAFGKKNIANHVFVAILGLAADVVSGTFGVRLIRENRLPPPEWPAEIPHRVGNLCGPLASQMAVSSN